jgi:hypothetical protein
MKNPFILDIGTYWRRVVSVMPRTLSPDTQWVGGWMGPRIGLNNVQGRKITPTETRNLTSAPSSL